MQTGRLHLRAKFHLTVFIVSASSVQKPQFWANIDFWGSCTDPLLPMRAKSGVLQLTTADVYVSKFVSIGLFYRPLAAKNPIFAVFWTSAFSDVDSWRQSEKVEHGCTTIFMVKSGAQTLTFKSVTDKKA